MSTLLAPREAPLSEALETRITTDFPEIQLGWYDQTGQRLDDGPPAEILLRSEIGRDALSQILAAHPSLRWMHTISAGVDHILPVVNDAHRTDLVITKGRGVMSRPIAEFALAMIFTALKGLPAFLQAQRDHRWQRRGVAVRDIRGAKLLILGLGSIGLEAARLARSVGMQVWGVRRSPGEPIPDVSRLFSETDEWRAVLPEIDVLLVALPLTDATRGIIGAPELLRLRSDAWVINIARGPLIDEDALIAALREKRLGGAGLDVTQVEPLPPTSPLWDLPNVILTPHNSWRSPAVVPAMLDLFLQNLRHYLAGEPLQNIVPRDAAY